MNGLCDRENRRHNDPLSAMRPGRSLEGPVPYLAANLMQCLPDSPTAWPCASTTRSSATPCRTRHRRRLANNSNGYVRAGVRAR
jgi:hypothetical protein